LLVDSDPTAADTFKKNFPKTPFWPKDLGAVQGSDILKLVKLKAGELDFLVGGPPCQGFSPTGKRWLEDNRNRLIARFIELVHQMRPKCAIVENVPAVLSAYERLFTEQIHEAFKGYIVKAAVLNASQFGVPQIRKRAFVVALREDLGLAAFDFPRGDYDAIEVGNDSHRKAKAHQRFVCVSDAIGDLPALKAGQSVDGGPYASPATSAYQEDRPHSPRQRQRGPARWRTLLRQLLQPGLRAAPRQRHRLHRDRQLSQSRLWALYPLPRQALHHCARGSATPVLRRPLHLPRL
jgi:DNA (cytosine-5)-methyltransferase 1